jgi:2-polyprenyl-6-methoxyphenol hydroxylase-like FAD-dependent oxidoreductase
MARMAEVVVVGAGVGGLASALCLARSGHRVVILERDDTPFPPDAAGAFSWVRHGAPQVRHTHAFLARLRNLLRDRHPDVLAALLDAGATEMRFLDMLPEGMETEPQPGDEDLVAIACRRSTYEWVLHRTVLAEPGVTLRHGTAVASLLGDPAVGDAPARVVGVVLEDGEQLPADLVVLASGRRSAVPDLLRPLGVEIDEQVEDTGIIYYSRFFELAPGRDYPPQSGPIGGDLGYLKYGVFLGDNRTFSITLAARTDDAELRSGLLDEATFMRAAAALPATAPYVVDGLAVPISGVSVMARLVNRRRTFTDDDGCPLVVGCVAVGDAHTCTNPLYGRGCSLAFVQAQLLADAWAAAGDDLADAARRYEAACRDEILPWYRAAVAQDAATRADLAGEPGADENPLRAMLRDGLLPAVRIDAVVFRAFLRMMNLLEPPESLMSDMDVIGRVMAVYQARDERPPEAPLGPPRREMLAALAAG